MLWSCGTLLPALLEAALLLRADSLLYIFARSISAAPALLCGRRASSVCSVAFSTRSVLQMLYCTDGSRVAAQTPELTDPEPACFSTLHSQVLCQHWC